MTDTTHEIQIDCTGDVLVDGVATGGTLTKIEEAYLRAVFSHKHVATKEYLLSAVYGGRDEPNLKIVDVIICHIRRKLGIHRESVRTVWGRGYAAHRAYSLAEPERTVGVNVDAELFGELLHITGEQPDALVTRLLKAEQERLWA
jgi:cysteine synthase